MANTRHLHVIKASAGSGKTYTLARTYIEDLLCRRDENGNLALRQQRDYHRHILAITFTNKATDEMKKRIVDSLFDLSQGVGEYVDYFAERLSAKDFEQLKVNAGRALADILFNYNDFAVSTIDSFFQTLLRTFAHEIDYDSGYDIELNDDVAIATAVHDFLLDISTERIKPGDNAYRWVKEFMTHRVNERKNWDFFGKASGSLADFAKNINKEFFRERGRAIEDYFSDMDTPGLSRVEQFRKALFRKINDEEQAYQDVGRDLLDLFRSHGVDMSDITGGGMIKKMCQAGLDGAPIPEPTAAVRRYLTEDEPLKQSKILAKDSMSKSTTELNDDFKATLGAAIAKCDRVNFLTALVSDVWMLGLLGVIDKKLHDNLRESNTILLSDTGELISKIVKGSDTPDNAAFIYERAGTRYNNYMIDEFQDTSQKQYNNFKPLITDSLAAGNDNLIIGDEKQSIYRFRNSDPSMLREQLEKHFARHYDDSTLKDNWRSFAAVIHFNNALFGHAPAAWFADYNILRLSYKNVEQNVRQKARQGFIRVDFAYIGNNKRDDVDARVLNLLPERIHELLDRGYDKSDIMVLVNRRNEGAMVVKKLLESGIDVVSEESLLLRNSPAIKMIINVMRFIETTLFVVPEDKDNKGVTKRVRRLVADQRRYHILHEYGRRLIDNNANEDPDFNPRQALEEILAQNRAAYREDEIEATIRRLAHVADAVLPDAATQPMHLLTLVDGIIKQYVATAENSVCTDADSTFLTAFVDEVARFTAANNGGTVREFLRYWDERCKGLSLPAAGNDAVQVMTIHKSKGLEAPIVIIPFADWELDKFNRSETLWIPREAWLRDNTSRTPYLGLGDDIVPPLVPVNNQAFKNEIEFNSFYHDELEKMLIDNFNKTYVAFTRPRQELHVWAIVKEDKRPDEVHTTGEMLLRFAYDLDDKNVTIQSPFELLYDEVELPIDDKGEIAAAPRLSSLVIGNADETKYVKRKDEKNDPDNSVEERDMPPYFVRPVPQAITVSVENNSGMHAREEGNDMHWFMSLIRDRRDIDYAYRLVAMGNRFDPHDTERYWTIGRTKDLLDKMLDNPTVAEWFDPGNRVINERAISGLNFDDIKRPDRVVVTPDGRTVVIDYKFGKDYTAAVIKKYTGQVKEYIALLRDAGFNNVEGYLWLLRHPDNPIRRIS